MEPTSNVLSELNHRIENLEERVSHLEHQQPSLSVEKISKPVTTDTAAKDLPGASWVETASTFGVLGRAMLGVAGGYIFRAVAESGALPKLVVAVAAILYAAVWLLAAAKTRGNSPFATAVYAGISVLLLAPMLWELTLSFGVFTPAFAASIIAAYILGAYLLAWRRRLTALILMAESGVVAISIAFTIGSKDLLPFIYVLLLTALLNEWAAIQEHWTRLRFIPALGANIAVMLLYSIYSRPESSRMDYPALSVLSIIWPAATLLGVYMVGAGVRTLFRSNTIRIFEILETSVAFLLLAVTLTQFSPAAGVSAFGAACIALSFACYTLVLRGGPAVAQRRNSLVYSAWGLGLLLFGGYVALKGPGPILLFGAAAIFFSFFAVRSNRLSLGYQGFTSLLAAAFVCGLFNSAAATFAGSMTSPPSLAGWLVCATAVLCYAAIWHMGADTWQCHFLRLGSAAFAVSAFAIGLTWAMIGAARSATGMPAWHIAVIRTLAGCLISVALAFAGPLFRHRELISLSYATLALLAIKLVTEDLRHGHAEFSAASIFLFATSVILVPRIVRRTSAPIGQASANPS